MYQPPRKGIQTPLSGTAKDVKLYSPAGNDVREVEDSVSVQIQIAGNHVLHRLQQH